MSRADCMRGARAYLANARVARLRGDIARAARDLDGAAYWRRRAGVAG